MHRFRSARAAVIPIPSPVRPMGRMTRALLSLVPLALLGAMACGGGGVPTARLRSEEAIERGRNLYAANCAVCHGQAGDGKGLRWESLVTPPTDFTDPSWTAEATPERLFVSIRTGLPGTAMPAWPALSDDETWDLVACVLAFDGEAGSDPRAAGGR